MPAFMQKSDVTVLLACHLAGPMLDRHGETKEFDSRLIDRAEGITAELVRRGIVTEAAPMAAGELYSQLQRLGTELTESELAELDDPPPAPSTYYMKAETGVFTSKGSDLGATHDTEPPPAPPEEGESADAD